VSSIRRSLTLPLLVGTVLLATAAMLLLYTSIRQTLLSQFDDLLRAKAVGLGSQVTFQPDGKLEFDYSDENYAEFRRARQPEYFQIRLSDGRTLERSATLNGQNLLQPTDLPPSASDPVPVTLPDGRGGREITVECAVLRDTDEPVAPGAATRPALARAPNVFVTVARDTAAMDETLSRLRLYLILTVLTLTTTIVTLVPVIVRRGLRPLHKLAEHVGRLDAQSLNSPFPAGNVPQELVPITSRLHDLLTRLRAAFEREARFTASAAHELRTPIAEVRTVAEVALQWPEMAQSQRALGDVVEVSHRMESLIDALMEIARSRTARSAGSPSLVDLRQTVDDVLRSSSSVAKDRGLQIDVVGDPVQVLTADPTMVRAIIANLISNAVQHATRDGAVEIELSRGDAFGRLEITNDSNDLDRADLPKLCEPFWTNSSSRSDGRHGLGLTLVGEYARIIGARLLLDLSPQREFRATIEFPGAQGPTLTRSHDQSPTLRQATIVAGPDMSR
jgi:signal transduction histidine kinase